MKARLEPSVDPFLDTEVIDARAPRTNQSCVAIVTAFAYIFELEALVMLMALQLIVGLVFGRRWCLPCLFYFTIVQPRFGEGRVEDSRPPRFANVVGALFLSVASLLLVAGFVTAGWIVTLIVTALAGFAAVSGVCVGCEIYVLIARMRGISLALR